ncbi:MAG TPA: hypothetical protein DCY88_19090 [Cyanobacteria bacterium UBA11372]|nr:hypothetical protein [Cyanobacteria bacterium UBA11372]
MGFTNQVKEKPTIQLNPPRPKCFQHLRIYGVGFTNQVREKPTIQLNPPRPKCFAFMGKWYKLKI